MGKAAGGAVEGEMSEGMGGRMGGAANKLEGKEGLGNRVRVRDADVSRLDGPPADAVVRVFRAVDGGRAILTLGVAVRTLTNLAGPADEGAGKNQGGQ